MVQSDKGVTTSLMLNTRRSSKNKKKTRTVNTEDSHQDILRITKEFQNIPSHNFKYIKKDDKKTNRSLFLLNKQKNQDNKDQETSSKEQKGYVVK